LADGAPLFGVIPAKAGIQSRSTAFAALDARFRGHDDRSAGQ
jgi:hypothetical protein